MGLSTRSRFRAYPLVQRLEDRRLLSGSWTTVNTDPTSYGLWGMAADKVGNVYAVGADNGNNANLRQETGGAWSTVVTVADGGQTEFNAVATDAAGDVFIAGGAGSSGRIWERPAGQSGIAVVDTLANGGYNAIATDAAGNVFATGTQSITTTTKGKTTTTNYAIVRKLTAGSGGFVGSTSSVGTSLYLPGITVIGSGAAAGVYAVGSSSSNYWDVFKSGDGGNTWSLVDQFRYSSGYGSNAVAVAGDTSGNVYVGGIGGTAVVTGNSRSGKPIYSTRNHWIVRKSLGGGSGSWSTNDDYLPAGATDASPVAMGTDLAGNLYAVGYSGTSLTHAIVRTNTGGSWSTSDDFSGSAGTSPTYNAFAVDSNGVLYAGGNDMWDTTQPTFVRSMQGPAAPLTASSFFTANSIATDTNATDTNATVADLPTDRPRDSHSRHTLQ